jgi:hypothetical protein
MTSPVIWQYRESIWVAEWWLLQSPATQLLSLYCHMTGEVIIQLPRYCLYAVIWQEKSSSSYPNTVSILSYDWRSHHPATRSCLYTVIWLEKSSSSYPIMSLYCHMTGEVIIQLPRYFLYTVIWLEKSSSSYPDTFSILSYDRRSHHPATQILSLCCLTSPVIWQYKDMIG